MKPEVAVKTKGGERPAACDVSFVLVCWNNEKLLESCLDSVYQCNLGCSFEVVVVDNGSTDGSVQKVRNAFPGVRLIENRRNLGFAGGTNKGVMEARGRFVLLLNTDALVNDASVDAMVRFMEQTDDAGAVGGTLLNEDGSFQSGYSNFSTLIQELMIASGIGNILWPGYPSHRISEKIVAVDWVSGACLLVRRSAFVESGGLDEEYFMYGEEVDFEFRIKRAGWKVYYLPYVHTIHYGGRSLDRWRRRGMVYRSKMLFYRKNYGWTKEYALRVVLAMTAVSKVLAWAGAYLVPRARQVANKELKSNLEILNLCLRLK